jgi:hypothetical protein
MRLLGQLFLLAIVASAVVLGAMRREEPVPLRAPVASTKPAIDRSRATQERRLELIRKLEREKVFMKTDLSGTVPKIWVDLKFYGLPFDEKQQFVSVVYAFFDGDVVRLYDGYNGKSIGRYTETGLSLR